MRQVPCITLPNSGISSIITQLQRPGAGNVEGVFDEAYGDRKMLFNRSSRLNTRVDFLFQGPVVKRVGQVNRAQNVPIPRLIHQ